MSNAGICVHSHIPPHKVLKHKSLSALLSTFNASANNNNATYPFSLRSVHMQLLHLIDPVYVHRINGYGKYVKC